MEQMNFRFGEWASGSSSRLVSRLYAAAHHVGQRVQSLRRTFADFGLLLRTGRSRLQEALREKETGLAKVLADSTEPVVVTDDAHRILAANAAALVLLGVSKSNLHRFAIDAFLPPEQIHYFERSGPRFIKWDKRVGECEIRPLGGKPRVVEFDFEANFTLGRHVSKFRDVAGPKPLPHSTDLQAALASKWRWIA